MADLTVPKRADISVMRIMATVAVVFLHTLSTLWINAESFSMTEDQYMFAYIGSLLMNWGVPVFLLITGLLLLDPKKEITVADCLKKYCRRAFLALVIFGFPYSWLETIMTEKAFRLSMFPQSLLNILTEKSWGHLWYLYALIGIYLTLPIWKGYIKSTSRKTQAYVLIVLFIINCCIPFINAVFQIEIAKDLPMVTWPVFYFLAGGFFAGGIPRWLGNKKRNVFLLVVMVLIFSAVSVFFYPELYSFLGNSSPVIAAITFLVFTLLQGLEVSEKSRANLWKLDRLCFGVYLIHPLFINFVYKFLHITPLSAGNFYWLASAGFCIVFLIVSFFASWVLRLIEPLKKYVL